MSDLKPAQLVSPALLRQIACEQLEGMLRLLRNNGGKIAQAVDVTLWYLELEARQERKYDRTRYARAYDPEQFRPILHQVLEEALHRPDLWPYG